MPQRWVRGPRVGCARVPKRAQASPPAAQILRPAFLVAEGRAINALHVKAVGPVGERGAPRERGSGAWRCRGGRRDAVLVPGRERSSDAAPLRPQPPPASGPRSG